MGEIADHYIDKMLDSRHYPKVYNTPKKRITWTTSTGAVYEPHEMEDEHLMSCIHLCEHRDGDKGIKFLNNAPTYIGLVDELISRGLLSSKYYKLTLNERLKLKI